MSHLNFLSLFHFCPPLHTILLLFFVYPLHHTQSQRTSHCLSASWNLNHNNCTRETGSKQSCVNLFTPISHVHSFQTRHSNNNLLLPYTRTTRHQFNISFRGPKLWSDLSPSLRSMSSYSAFKKHLKRLLLLAWRRYVVFSRYCLLFCILIWIDHFICYWIALYRLLFVF